MAETEKTKKDEGTGPRGAEAAPRVRAKDERRERRRSAKADAGPHASLSFLHIAPRKVRLGANNVRGVAVGETLTVDGGPKMRRFMARAMGRAFRIEKRTSHVYVELGTGARA